MQFYHAGRGERLGTVGVRKSLGGKVPEERFAQCETRTYQKWALCCPVGVIAPFVGRTHRCASRP